MSKKTQASYILDGNIRKIDNILRVKVDLIEGESVSNIWSETYDKELTGQNVFILQDMIINEIVNQLVGTGAILLKDIVKKIETVKTDDLSIYECVNLARKANTNHRKYRSKAIECLKVSVKKDPNYAPSWIWLAERTRNLYADNAKEEYNHLLKDANIYLSLIHI